MPKDIIDYSNTIIYKIICNEPSITDIYIGHTTNFIKRKYQHKMQCKNSSKLNIYNTIRNHGGWENWSMIEIAKYDCKDVTEARIKEKQHYELLKTYKKETNDNQSITTHNEVKFFCLSCSKPYQSRNGLWKHQKKCIADESSTNIKESILSDKQLMMMLVKQNSELMEVIKNGTHNNISINTNNNHSHNKTFNLQFFLNETCKGAMNIGDFVSSIKPQIADLEATGRLGYVEGISNIILNNLKILQIHDRPIHCSDQKREVIYIKDNNEWTKEEDSKPILTKAIKVIANENIKNITEWRNENPDCTNSESKKNNLYLKIVSNSMSGGSVEESNKNIHKIISNIAKQVVIDKSGKDYLL